ncbi:MAG: prepilin peptidase [Alphaproteobacteria bacterium]
MDSGLLNFILNIASVIIGLMLGSFVSLASYRFPLGEEIIIKSSHCPKCNNRLGIKDLFPVFSWLFSKGKCRYCNYSVSFRYPLIEMITAIITLLIHNQYGFTYIGLIYLLIAICLVILIITDFEHYIIPDQIQLALLVISIFYNAYINNISFDPIVSSLIATATGIALRKVIFIWKKQDPLGIGDIKFLAVSGLYLKPEILPVYLFLSGTIGILTAIFWQIIGKGKIFPFGPALAISMFICLMHPQINNILINMISNLILKIG